MGEIAPMIKDLGLILIVAGAVTLIFKKLKQPLVLGYIVAGFLVSNHMPYMDSVTDNENVKLWGEIGVMFLLFSLGLDFSFKKIVKMGAAPIISVFCIITAMITLGILVGNGFGWGRMDCIFLGGMLAMSSTTIIYKAFADLGISQEKFAGLVMSVLILEDILAIVMMVMLSTIASGKELGLQQVIDSVLNIGFFLVLWLVAGIFAIPWFFRKVKSLMNDEVMLVVSLGLCCCMAETSTEVGFSSAFGAFIMGSILAETVEAKYIEHLIAPVKNLFGAIFFVSVGMLVDPQVLIDYALPIIVLVLTIIVGQCLFGTLSYRLGGQSLKDAMRCGFSMTQIGEFSFIIASLGLSLGVISEFLYPVVVAVSVITTFGTPYMIRLAEPAYSVVARCLPARSVASLSAEQAEKAQTKKARSPWVTLLMKMSVNTIVWLIVAGGVLGMVGLYLWPFMQALLPKADYPWYAEGITGVAGAILIAPLMWGIVTNNNDSEAFRTLWAGSATAKCLLSVTVVVRFLLAADLIFYIIYELAHPSYLVTFIAGIAITLLLLAIPWVKRISHSMEQLFLENLHAKDTSDKLAWTPTTAQ